MCVVKNVGMFEFSEIELFGILGCLHFQIWCLFCELLYQVVEKCVVSCRCVPSRPQNADRELHLAALLLKPRDLVVCGVFLLL